MAAQHLPVGTTVATAWSTITRTHRVDPGQFVGAWRGTDGQTYSDRDVDWLYLRHGARIRVPAGA